MISTKHEMQTRDGVADVFSFHSDTGGPWPGVIVYMDGPGIRPAMKEMASRLASLGYYVLLPNLYYRSNPQAPFNTSTAFQPGPERDRMMKLFSSINQEKIMADTAAFLQFLAKQPQVRGKNVGAVGYCMGGQYALSAAGFFPDRIAAAASFHGARLATDQPDSPHRLAPKMRGKIYVGIAELDTHFTPEEKDRLERALTEAKVRHTLEVYPGVKHGWAVDDHPVYERAAAERHWTMLEELFRETL
jgi:carboxymethylenebutenolidase